MRTVILGSGLPIALAMAAATCTPPPQPPPPPVDDVAITVAVETRYGTPVSGATVWCNEGHVSTTTDAGGVGTLHWPRGIDCALEVRSAPFQLHREIVAFSDHGAKFVTLNRVGRSGQVRADGRAFADGDGQVNALGVSLFWSLWGEAHEPDRLDRNLAYAAEHGVDFVRVLGMVGTPSWSDRVIDPAAPDYWSTVENFLTRLSLHGLRAHVTLFADAQVMMPSMSAREAFVDRWAQVAARYSDRIFAFEVANEYWQNGFSSTGDVQALGHRLRAQTSLPVALSAPQEADVRSMYDGWPGVATLHPDRNVSLSDGFWRPVRQPWGYPGEYFTSGVPAFPFMNSEPIGPKSSGAEDADPLRLAMGYATTFVAGGASYTYHPGSGIRGGGQADLDRGRQANLYDEDPAILEAIGRARALLPPGIASWTRHNAQWGSMPWDGSQHAVDRGDIVRFYAATSGRHLVAVALGVRRPHSITARARLNLTLYDPATAVPMFTIPVEPGASAIIPDARPGWIVVGTAE